MEELVKYIVKSIVDKPEEVVISETAESEKVIILSISVAAEDIGKVIGKGGKVASAIRSIVKTASAKSGKRFIVKIKEN